MFYTIHMPEMQLKHVPTAAAIGLVNINRNITLDQLRR